MTRTPPYRLSTEAEPAVDAGNVLLCVTHGEASGDVPPWELRTGLPHLAGPQREWWLSDTPVRDLGNGDLGLRANADIGFGKLGIPEAALRSDCAAACETAFARILEVLPAAGLPHLLRSWIYLGHIHAGTGDAERYRQFCVGRGRALAAAGLGASAFPAATVIGRPIDGASLHFLAGREPAEAIENPRQTSAFDYPRRYGPQPPSFVRAQRTRWGALIVSGTAAVVGHESRHPGDTAAQLRETERNLAALREAAGGEWQPRRAVVYLRDSAELSLAQSLSLGGDVSVLQGAICRPELMVEIEALYEPAGDGPKAGSRPALSP
jgi:chorismate lyase/3-hydroxybenzoate synthase